MRETTKKRHERIRQAAAHMYGKMPVMKLYVALGEDFGMSDEQIRKILAHRNREHRTLVGQKKHPP